MKVRAFLDVLRPYSAVIAAHGGRELAAHANTLGDVWATAMTWNVKDLLTKAFPSAELPEADETSVRQFREALVQLREVVKTVAKQDVVADLSSLIAALEPHDREDLGAFVKACQLALEASQSGKAKKGKTAKKPAEPVDEARVASAVQRLRETYKDAGQFGPVYEAISNDDTVSQAELAAIATQFAYETPPTTKKPESLRRIWLVHESYATAAAKSRFSGGRSAA